MKPAAAETVAPAIAVSPTKTVPETEPVWSIVPAKSKEAAGFSEVTVTSTSETAKVTSEGCPLTATEYVLGCRSEIV